MVTMEKMRNVVHGLKPVLLMVSVQASFATVNVFYKLAAIDGMKLPILVAYRFLFSAVFIVPLALFVERNKRPKLTWIIQFQAFCCGLFGRALHRFQKKRKLHLYAFGCLMILLFWMERLGWKTSPGTTKIMGTILGVGGAMLLTFYKGIEIHIWKSNVDLLHGQTHATGGQHSGNRVLGSLLAIVSCFSYSSWLIIQTKMVEKYPCPYSVTALTSTMGAVQAVVFGLCTERDWREWKLGWNIRLLTVLYTGMFASGLMFTLIAWCVQMRGPLFVSAFNPFMLVLVVLAGSLLLNEALHMGSVLGAILITFGLYMVLWGKGKEVKKVAQLMPARNSSIGTGVSAIDGESERSSVLGGNGESKRSGVLSANGESKCIDVVVVSSI